MRAKARYVMIGGFLGAGKTTAVARLARELVGRGLTVGLITNDQSSGLVDSSILRSHGFDVEEIAGGCFCCRFASLSEAAARLTERARPHVFIAEPVGSCTDLVATVSYPLRRIYGDCFTIAPLSVLVDPQRALRVLGLAAGRPFSEKVVYVYEKQLEEAELIVVNKADELAAEDREQLVGALETRFPRAEVLVASALDGSGTAEWFARISEREAVQAQTMELDYATYAEGEAELGWLNMTARVTALEQTFDANALLVSIGTAVRERLVALGAEIAHLKATLDAGETGGQLAAMSLTSSAGAVDLREALVDGVRAGELVFNLRAEADPATLRTIALEAFEEAGRGQVRLELEHEESFRPAPPVPTHRMLVGQDGRELRA